MARCIYLSCNFHDHSLIQSLPAVQKNAFGLLRGKFVFIDTRDSSPDASDPQAAAERLLQESDGVIFLLGSESPLMEREAELAIARGLPVIGARIKGTTEQPPARLRYWKRYREMNLQPGLLEKVLNSLAKNL